MNRSSSPLATRPDLPQKRTPPAGTQQLLALAQQHYEAGRLAEAEKLCLQILAIDTRYADGLYLLGMTGYRTGRFGMAEKLIRRAIAVNPKQPFYHSNLGNVLNRVGRLDEAVACYERALALRPDFAEASFNLGNTYHALGKFDEAVASYQRALSVKPGYAEAHCNLGNALQKQKKFEEAQACYEKALTLKPDYLDARCNLGNVLQAQKRHAEALTSYGQALILNPDLAEAHNGMGNVLESQDKLEQAVACYEQALARRPDYVEAWANLGVALMANGRLDEALKRFTRALELQPDYALAQMNMGMLQLLTGDLASGWRNYESRWKIVPPRQFSPPLWRGQSLSGARILLHAEQGLGDCVQFLRYLPRVQAAGGTVVLEVPARLRRLAAQLPGVEAVVNAGDPLPPFNWHCPLMSLPLIYATTLETIPAEVPYLTVPDEALETASALPWPTNGLRVGLVWAGSPDHFKNRLRSIPLDALEPLFSVEGVHFFSLQMGAAAANLSTAQPRLTDLAPVTGDMADTAAQIAQLDLVITVDTSVAHLAGALGKPTWVLLSYAPDWRWLLDREDSPWYPTMRLFRQPKLGDWPSVVEQVCTQLRAVAEGNRALLQPSIAPDAHAQGVSTRVPKAGPATSECAVAFPYQLARTRHGTMLVNSNDMYMGQSFLKYGESNENEIQLLLNCLGLPGEVIEAGANMGVHTVPLGKELARQGRSMMVFEPQPVIFQQLCANLALNGLTNVNALPYACGKKRGAVSFQTQDYRRRGNFGGVSMSDQMGSGQTGSGQTDGSATVTVPCYALDDLAPEAQVSLIKIDVEGFELQVLEGARKILERCHPALYVENDRPAQSPQLIQWLLDRSYRLWWHVTKLYNPNNFFAVEENIFGDAASFNMLCLHQYHGTALEGFKEITDPSFHPLA